MAYTACIMECTVHFDRAWDENPFLVFQKWPERREVFVHLQRTRRYVCARGGVVTAWWVRSGRLCTEVEARRKPRKLALVHKWFV